MKSITNSSPTYNISVRWICHGGNPSRIIFGENKIRSCGSGNCGTFSFKKEYLITLY